MKKLFVLALVILLCSTSVAFGYVMGSTNLDFMGYPTCDKKVGYSPDRPYSHDAYAISQYRSEVENYIYSVDEYVKSCNNDINRIVEERNNAIKEANKAVEDFNNYAKGY